MMETHSAWRLVWMALVRLAIAAAIVGLVYRYLGILPTLFAFIFVGSLMAKPIIEAGDTWLAWSKGHPFAKWQGRYYEFAGTQIRVHPVGKVLWFAGEDVMRVIGEKPSLMTESTFDAHEYDDIPGTRLKGFSEEGVEKLLRASDHYEAKRMLIWIQREVVKPYRKKLEIAESQGRR